MIVVDASVLAPSLIDEGDLGDGARGRLEAQDLAAPDLIYLEVVSMVRMRLSRGLVDPRRASDAVSSLIAMPLGPVPHQALVRRAWDLRHNISPYDGAHVALAELLDAPLLTADRKLANAPGPRCVIEVLAA